MTAAAWNRFDQLPDPNREDHYRQWSVFVREILRQLRLPDWPEETYRAYHAMGLTALRSVELWLDEHERQKRTAMKAAAREQPPDHNNNKHQS